MSNTSETKEARTLTLPTLAKQVIAAYGGEDRWRAATAVEATVSFGGLFLLAKWQSPHPR